MTKPGSNSWYISTWHHSIFKSSKWLYLHSRLQHTPRSRESKEATSPHLHDNVFQNHLAWVYSIRVYRLGFLLWTFFLNADLHAYQNSLWTGVLRCKRLMRPCLSIMYPDRAVDTFQITSAQIPIEQIPSGQWTNMKWILVRFRGKSLIKHGPKWAVDTSQAGSEQIPGGQWTDLKWLMVRFKVGSPRVDSKQRTHPRWAGDRSNMGGGKNQSVRMRQNLN